MLIGHLFSAVSHQFASKPPSCTFFLSRGVWLSRDSPLESNRERTDRQAGCLLKVGYRWERCHLTGKHRKRFKPYIYISISINIYMNKAGRIYMYIYDQLYSRTPFIYLLSSPKMEFYEISFIYLFSQVDLEGKIMFDLQAYSAPGVSVKSSHESRRLNK